MDLEPYVDIDAIIKSSIEALPRRCRGLKGAIETHEWVNHYDDATFYRYVDSKGREGQKFYNPCRSKPTRLLPYQICRYCHKRKES